MNKSSPARRAQILGMMVEGISIRAISRMTGASKNTIVKLLADAGKACAEYQDRTLRNLPCKRIQADEIWSFVYTKAKNVPEENAWSIRRWRLWTWTTLCADTKLVPSWYVGPRDAESAHHIMQDVASRLTNRVQLTTDGFHGYLDAVDAAFPHGDRLRQLVKIDGTDPMAEKRYSPSVCLSAESRIIRGNPDRDTYQYELC